ncbi:unnamed protein product [Litomosoides sigmodontis]|uniref:Uncharacterized protein n=1 Tax=Litomosoides sigmodontis TaxID=42156 RepID=A0A3P6T8A4_LITSI|nr:unnamed protein product [Litomosoides sigmodontis]
MISKWLLNEIHSHLRLSEMKKRKDVMKTDDKCGLHAYRIVHHFQKYAKKCVELNIPAPFAAEMTRSAAQSLRDMGFEEKAKLCHCFRCNLDLTSTKTVSFRLSVPKRKVKKPKSKGNRRPYLIAVCKGCGAEMKGGALATVDYENQGAQTSSSQNSKRLSLGFSGQSSFSSLGTSLPRTPISSQIAEEKISSSARRRKKASKLQLLLSSQTPARSDSNLQDFLETFKINTR